MQLANARRSTRKALGFRILAQAAQILGSVLDWILLRDANEDVPIHCVVEPLIQIPDVIQDLLAEVNGLLEDVVGKVNEFPQVQRLGARKTAGYVAAPVDEIPFAVNRTGLRIALEG